ncbi:MAG: PD40 domain-containing protein [Verrucomicrobiae bacterium]|nr:PD40 domain-containing protein [Verrucomicrobiae bacterium]
MHRALLAAVLLLCLSAHAASPEGYYRYPAIHDDTVVFTSEGDLWRVAASGGLARRLTAHPGMESFAAISPDGSTIAFSAQYEGPTEVYTMPVHGGLPVRRTFDGVTTRVAGWTPDGRILIRTAIRSTLPAEQLAILRLDRSDPEWLPLYEASEAAFDPASGDLYFTRLPKQGSSTKRYRGGWIQNLWRFPSKGDAAGAGVDREAVLIHPEETATSRNPMGWQGRLYFISDRDGIMNLWSSLPDGSDMRQHTHHRDFDVAEASLHAGRIAYQHGADLRLHDLVRDTDARIPIQLASDFDQQRERWVKDPVTFLTSAHPSPDGDRVVLTARGQVFIAPVGQGRFVEVPRLPNVRYRNARFLPDGTNVVALSDATGELEFWRFRANGTGGSGQLTDDGTVFRFGCVPSPDGRWIAWGDKDLRLWIRHLERRESILVAESRMTTLTDFSWSPDSQWLAYTDVATNTYSHIKLYRLSDAAHVTVTGDRTDSSSPAWSPDGKWLYFLSDRHLRSLVGSPWGSRQPDPHFTEGTKIYQVALTHGLRSPFAPADELHAAASRSAGETRTPDAEKPGSDVPNDTTAATNQVTVRVQVDVEGLGGRLSEVPVPPGNYASLSVTAKHLLWTSRPTGFDAKTSLMQLEVTAKDPKPKTLVEDIRSHEVTADGRKLLVRKGDDFHIVATDAAAPAKLDEKLNLAGWTFPVQPREEWRQIFTESWRMMRDYFYDRGMHRLDWASMLDKYRPLIDRVSDRAELSDVIAAMVGELSTLHINVGGGDERDGPDNIRPASLGARLGRDEAAGGWRIQHIHRADPDYPDQWSPLVRPDLSIRTNDVLVAINGRPTLSVPHPSALLRNQAGKQVLIEVKDAESGEIRPYIVNPIPMDREANLRYREWELTRRERVEELGRGAIGYVHLRAMTASNIAEWARDFYPVYQRQGLIIDVRNNRGGNIDSWILGKLLRKAWFYWQPRVGDPFWNMQYAFRGHLVVLCNARTASDGEAFAEGFRRLGLGKVIGTRTWGGEIWLSAQRWLVDRGMATAAEIGVYGPEGEWLIEGHGVDPDIVVDNPPHATFLGQDAQLDAAIRHLQERIESDPRPVPPAPPYPDKSFPARPADGR